MIQRRYFVSTNVSKSAGELHPRADKPEPLRDNLKGWWSRRITAGDRLVYRMKGNGKDQVLEIIQCRMHH
jgi:Txe/YoeB family toxin of Txe-Axe toxin-antitoxin module